METFGGNKLIPCLECGAHISPNASACPKCKEKSFRGVGCSWCHKILKASEAFTWDKIDVRPIPEKSSKNPVYHRACLQTIVPDLLPDKLPCKECGVFLKRSSVIQLSDSGYFYGGFKPIPCSECGTPTPIEFDRCAGCSIPVFLAGHYCVLTKDRKYCFTGYNSGKDCYHAACYKLYFDEQVDNEYSSIFGYEAEYSKGKLTNEEKGDDYTRKFLKLRCQRAKQKGKTEVTAISLNGPFKSFLGYTIQNYGIAKKSLNLWNLTENERELAKKIEGWGYSLFVSRYPFRLMIRL